MIGVNEDCYPNTVYKGAIFMVKEINQGDFEVEVKNSELPVLIDMWAPWCGPCKMVSPVVEAISKDFEGKLKVCKMNTDENQQAASEWGITGIPALLFFKGGVEVERVVGFQPKERLAEKVKQVLG
jgi:thioredoxin 1